MLSASPIETKASSLNAMQNNPVVKQAIEDLAQRESITPDKIEVVSVEEMVWPDTSMGCPHPDMQYMQVLQDGMRIILRANGHEHAYHSGGNRGPFLCDRKISAQGIKQIDQNRRTDDIDH